MGGWLLWLAVLGAPPEALGPDFDPGRAAEAAEARGELAEAEALYAQRYAADPEPGALLSLARAAARGPARCSDGQAAYRRFALACPTCPERGAAATEAEALARACQATLAVRRPDVAVDGTPAPKGAALVLAPGPHRVQVGDRVATVCLEAGAARAVEGPPPGAQPLPVGGGEAEAKAAEYEAFAHLSGARWCEAVDALARAHRAVPNPGYLFNLAAAWERWEGHCGEALRGFQRYLEVCPGCAEASKARAEQDRLLDACGGTVSLEGLGAGWLARLDGALLTGPTRAAPGPHVLRIEGPGGAVERAFALPGGGARRFSWQAPLPMAPAPQVDLRGPPPPPPEGVGPGPVVAGAVAGAGLVVGVVGLVLASRTQGELDAVADAARLAPDDGRSAEARGLVRRGQRERAAGWAGLSVAVSGAAVAGLWAWLGADEEDEE
jgi:tetratricopeptide (TPR) repeat protein